MAGVITPASANPSLGERARLFALHVEHANGAALGLLVLDLDALVAAVHQPREQPRVDGLAQRIPGVQRVGNLPSATAQEST